MHAECYQNRWVWFLHVLDLWSMILYIIKNDLSLNSRVLVSNSPVYWWFSSKYPEINSVKCSLHASLLRNSHLFRQSWVFPFFPLKVVLCVKKCDLSRYTWLLLDRLLWLSHFCTRNAASLTVLDQALSVTSVTALFFSRVPPLAPVVVPSWTAALFCNSPDSDPDSYMIWWAYLQNPGNFCLRNPKPWNPEYGSRNPESH